MRKALAFLVSVCLIGALGLMITGCEQQTPEVKTIQAAPKNLVVKGIVYSRYYVLGSSYYEDKKGGPLSGATVTLTGSFETMTDITDASGEYVFQNIPYGSYTMMVTKEGYQNTLFYIYEFEAFGGVPEGTIRTFDREISDHPVIRSLTPAPDSTIETSAVFTVVFNEPMDTSTVRPKIVSAGLRTFAAGDTANVTTAWSSNDTVLTITPNTTLLPNMNYRLYLADEFERIKDKAGNILAVGEINSSYRVPVFEPGAYINPPGGYAPVHYITYRTASGGVPGAPSGLQLFVDDQVPSDLDYNNADEGDEWVSLNWFTAAGEVTGYKVYAAKSSAGPYMFVKSYATNDTSGLTVDDINYAIYGGRIGGSNPTIDPVCNDKGAFINDKIYFKVVAYNGEGESAAVTADAQDSTGPQLNGNAAYGSATLSNGYLLSDLSSDNTKAYIAFQEPVNLTDAGTAGNYSLSPSGAIESVTVMTSSSFDLGMVGGSDYTVVLVDADTPIDFASGVTLTISGIKDLAGNEVESGTGDDITF